jgi:hypothetical protein
MVKRMLLARRDIRCAGETQGKIVGVSGVGLYGVAGPRVKEALSLLSLRETGMGGACRSTDGEKPVE